MLIGLSGKSGSGKTPLAKYLMRKHGLYPCSFSNPIREFCSENFTPSPDEDPLDFYVRPTPERTRHILQLVGEAGRIIHEDYWLRQVPDPAGNTVFDDVRYPNEARWIQERGGVLWRLNRWYASAPAHKSEIALDFYRDWDAVYEYAAIKHTDMERKIEEMFAWASRQLATAEPGFIPFPSREE